MINTERTKGTTMNKQTLNDIISLTQECLTRFWQLDPEFVIGYFDKDIIWIGSAQSQFTEGYDDTVADFRGIMKELVPCHLLRQEFFVAQNVGNTCTVVGKYLTTTDDSVGYYLQVQQRCTFVWELDKGEKKIKHIHISNPMGELQLAEGEKVPNKLGQMSKKYWKYRLHSAQSKDRIVVTDKNDVTHFLIPSEIVYATANGRNCDIHTLSGRKIEARMSITDFLEKIGDGFSAVHRSYVVNNQYIARIHSYEVVMADNTRIPIPVKKYIEIKDALTAHYDIEIDE